MIPRQAVEYRYPRPSYYGGLLSVYPILQKDQQYGLFYETQVAWYGADSGVGRSGGHGPWAWADKPTYNSEVWTIQYHNAPGYYITPQQMEDEAFNRAYWDSTGIGDWQLGSGWELWGQPTDGTG